MKFLLSILLLVSPAAFAERAEIPVQVFFSPEDHLADQLIGLIEQEASSIGVAAYAFTHWKIAKALCAAKERGVNVEIIIDPFSLKFSSIIKKLAKSEIPIWVWDPTGSSTEPALMHDKFCVFGENVVWTGSFNFTYSADHFNRENALLIKNPDMAKKFKVQFQALKQGCKKYKEKAKG
ncbi:MAG: phospholipase D-like domain-containing protein [Chlamydiales bacterium]